MKFASANCGDHHDDIIQNQEDELKKKVTEMERAIHHVMLNEKLQECFNLLDQIQRTYRNYNDEYIKILHNYPNQMDTFFEEFVHSPGSARASSEGPSGTSALANKFMRNACMNLFMGNFYMLWP